MLSLISFGLTDGGTAGLIYGFIVCMVGFSLVYLSISEMASMLVPSTSSRFNAIAHSSQQGAHFRGS